MNPRNAAELEARVRQLLAVDRNALDTYMDLAAACERPDLAAQLREIAADEARHVAAEEEILDLLARHGERKTP